MLSQSTSISSWNGSTGRAAFVVLTLEAMPGNEHRTTAFTDQGKKGVPGHHSGIKRLIVASRVGRVQALITLFIFHACGRGATLQLVDTFWKYREQRK